MMLPVNVLFTRAKGPLICGISEIQSFADLSRQFTAFCLHGSHDAWKLFTASFTCNSTLPSGAIDSEDTYVHDIQWYLFFFSGLALASAKCFHRLTFPLQELLDIDLQRRSRERQLEVLEHSRMQNSKSSDALTRALVAVGLDEDGG